MLLILSTYQKNGRFSFLITWGTDTFDYGHNYLTYDEANEAGELAMERAQEIVYEYEELNAPSLPC